MTAADERVIVALAGVLAAVLFAELCAVLGMETSGSAFIIIKKSVDGMRQ